MNALHELHLPSSRISATHILQRSVWNALNHFPCEVVTVKSASMVLTLYKHIHMEVGRLISCHYQPIHYLFYGLCKESDETVYQSHANAWELSSDIKCMLHLLTERHGAVRSQPLEVGERTCELSAYCALQYLTSSRDLPVILDIRPLIPADCYKQMLNVRCDGDRGIVCNTVSGSPCQTEQAGYERTAWL